MHEGNLELNFPRVIYERGMLVIKRPSKNNRSGGDHGITTINMVDDKWRRWFLRLM